MSVPTKYSLGIKVGNSTLPDPSEFKYTTASLDASAERDMSGTLIRDMVATKHNVSLTWSALSWSTIKTILGLVQGETFQFSFPSPETGAIYTGTYYVGDREVDAILLPAGEPDEWTGSLSFNLIEV